MTDTASIFNDVLAPVTPGPSSGCTGAPFKISKIGCSLLGEKPVGMKLEIASNSGYVRNLHSMRSDLSFIAGVLGRSSTHPRFMNGYEDAESEGIKVEFTITDEVLPYNQDLSRLYLYGNNGAHISLYSESIGGGLFIISEVEGCSVNIDGTCYETLLFCDSQVCKNEEITDKVKTEVPLCNDIRIGEGKDLSVIQIRTGDAISREVLEELGRMDGVKSVRTADPVHPIARSKYREPLFKTSGEMLEYAAKTGYPLWKIAVEYEKSLSGWTDEQIVKYADYLLKVTEESAKRGFEEKGDMHGYVPNRAGHVKKSFTEDKRLLFLGAIDKAAPYSLGIMEDSNASGTIVCIPTGGSSGIVPRVIYGVAEQLGKTRDERIKALLTAGLMGIFMYATKYNGNIGCQAEIGCAVLHQKHDRYIYSHGMCQCGYGRT